MSSTQPRVGPEAPRLPERYRPRRHIATGGMASVWCADDLVLDRRVAIKVLSERFADDQAAVRRFKREARTAARLSTHAHVVTVFDVGDLEPAPGTRAGRAFLVMEYLAGGTVADAIRVGAIRRHESMRWLAEAASALDHAHARDIVHRDVKPANFLLDGGRALYVADFGIARLLTEETITSDELFGTAAYLSPEQALGRPATGASDRYALAVVAFELLTGERPYASPHFAAQARQHIEDVPPRASERDRTLPSAVDPVLARAMAKEPEERYTTAGEFVAALRTALTQAPAPAPRRAAVRPAPGRAAVGPAPAGHPHRRGRTIALAAMGAMLVAVAGVLAATLGGSSGAHRTAAASANGRRAGASHHRSSTVTRATTTSTGTAIATAERLQQTGHQEMLDRQFTKAIGTLRQAVSTSPHNSLTYAYALFDLGRTLVLSGDPQSAIPILEKRLQIPNQTAVVKQMLDEALTASGQTTPTSSPSSSTTSSSTSTTSSATSSTPTETSPAPPAPSGPDPGPGHGHGAGPTTLPRPNGGAGLGPPHPGRGHAIQRTVRSRRSA